jgi:hypothetical protein
VQAETGGAFKNDELGLFRQRPIDPRRGRLARLTRPTDAQQIFGQLTWRGDDSRVDVSHHAASITDHLVRQRRPRPEDLLSSSIAKAILHNGPTHTLETR